MQTRNETKMLLKKAVLILGWGQDGCKDIEWIAKALGYDESLDCVKGKFADSRLVLDEIAEWLRDHANAQTLYIGAHGYRKGLVPRTRSTDKIDYRELGKTITANASLKARPLTVILGACQSSVAAEAWNALDQDSVRLLIGFHGRPDSDTVQGVLTDFLTQGDILWPGSSKIDNELLYLEEGIAKLRRDFPKVEIHFNEERLTNVQTLPEKGEGSLLHVLERRGAVKPGSLLWEAAASASRMTGVPAEQHAKRDDKERSRLEPRWIGPKVKPK